MLKINELSEISETALSFKVIILFFSSNFKDESRSNFKQFSNSLNPSVVLALSSKYLYIIPSNINFLACFLIDSTPYLFSL